jgi:hypothetical protein
MDEHGGPPSGGQWPAEGAPLTIDGWDLPPWKWEWGESADGFSWYARPLDEVDPGQRWRRELEPLTLNEDQILLARSHMCGFMRATDPQYRTWWAADLLSDRITQCTRRMMGQHGPGTLGAVIARVPTQHCKTYLFEEYAPPFIATQDPCARVVDLCYARNLSKRNIRVCRKIMKRPQYQQLSRARAGRFVDLEGVSQQDEDHAHMIRFMVDGGDLGVVHGPGYYFSVGTNSELTGWGYEAGIAGDLVKTPDEAFSPHHREKLLARVQSMFFTRMQTNSVFMLAMSPWHPEDISYSVQKLALEAGIDCEVIELPARAEVGACKLHPDDPRRPGSNEILDHVRHDEDFYKRFAVLCGRFYKSLGLLAPENYGPLLVSPETWCEFDPLQLLPAAPSRPPLARVVHAYLSVDTNGDDNGPSFAHISLWLCVELGGTIDPGTGKPRRMLWKIGQVAGAWDYTTLKNKIFRSDPTTSGLPPGALEVLGRGLACDWTVIIERKALGPAIVNELELARPRLLASKVRTWHLESEYPQGSKRLRADQCTPYIASGLVALPGSPLRPELVGAAGGALAWLANIGWVVTHRQAWGSHPNPIQGAHDLVDADSQVIRYAAKKRHIILQGGQASPLGLGPGFAN